MLERMILNLIGADQALRVALDEPLVEGSKGQQVENPMFQVAARCDTQARNTAKELRLLKPKADSKGDKPASPWEDLDGAGDEISERRAKREAS